MLLSRTASLKFNKTLSCYTRYRMSKPPRPLRTGRSPAAPPRALSSAG